MKILYSILATILLGMGYAQATSFTFTTANDVQQTKDGYSVAIDKGTGNNPPAIYSDHLRLYASNTITVSGENLQNIILTFSKQGSKEYATLTATPGTLTSGGTSTSNDDLVNDTWSGSASSVTFTLGASGQRIIYSIVVNGDSSEIPETPGKPSDPSQPDTPDGLDPDFKYPAIALLAPPSKSVQGDAYSFVAENIEVSCTKGAVTSNYFSAHAGFDMTFTATKAIKGIVINGFVKKDFTATVNHGSVSYLTPAEDAEANPVVVITDVNSNSVTISCVKQLRCYTVEVYFDANPEATVSGGNSGNGGETDLTFDTAEAVYETEYSEEAGMDNYTIFLFNMASYDYPYFALDLYPDSKDNLAGTYSWDDWTLGDFTYYIIGEGDDDIFWAEDGEITISKSGNIYTIKGWIYCDNGVTYNISFTGEMPIYTDDEYYGDGEEGAVEEIQAADIDENAPMYDIMGRKVGKDYRGIYIKGGKKHIGR